MWQCKVLWGWPWSRGSVISYSVIARTMNRELESFVMDLAGFMEPGKDEDKETTREDQEDLSKVKGSRAKCYKRTSDESSRGFKGVQGQGVLGNAK